MMWVGDTPTRSLRPGALNHSRALSWEKHLLAGEDSPSLTNRTCTTICSAGTDFSLLMPQPPPGLSNIKGNKRSAILGVSLAGRRAIAIMVPNFFDVDRQIFELYSLFSKGRRHTDVKRVVTLEGWPHDHHL